MSILEFFCIICLVIFGFTICLPSIIIWLYFVKKIIEYIYIKIKKIIP